MSACSEASVCIYIYMIIFLRGEDNITRVTRFLAQKKVYPNLF